MESYQSSKIQSWLGWFFRGILVFGFLILAARLVELTIIKGEHFKLLSEGNRIRRIAIKAPRGKILSRGGEILAGNSPSQKKIVFDPVEGYEKVDDLRGAESDEIITEWERTYPLAASAAHLTGYLGEVDGNEVGKINPNCFEKGVRLLGSLTGRSGLEEEYECLLAGRNGEELVEVDSTGQKVRTLGTKEPSSGEDLETTIHIGLQKKIASVMDGERGAVIATDTKGEVLALYSSPAFDPKLFIDGTSSSKIDALLNDKDLPFFNRVISGAFHPGSVIKPLIATAAIEEGEIDEEYTFVDEGIITIDTLYGEFSYSNWYFTQYGGKEGEIGIVKAIARSTDTFFYKLGELLGVDHINKWLKEFGLGEKSGIDLPGEISGLIPSPEWKEKVKGEKWFLGNTFHLAIGQGDIALTPLEVNTLTRVIANDATLCLPRITGKTTCKKLSIEKKTIDLVKKGMVAACSDKGTGFTFFGFEPQVACKTGTAETGFDEVTHAWFSVFAPVDFPEIVLTVLVEEGGEGSKIAGPIATEIFEYWFNQ